MQKRPVKGVPYGPWPEGMNNKLPTSSVPSNLLRWAVNVDIDDTGRLRSRKSILKVKNGEGTHSLYSCPLGTYYVDGSTLKRLKSDLTTVNILTNISGKLAYEYLNNKIYFSDFARTGIINADDTVSMWGPATDVEVSVEAGDGSYIVDRYNPVPTGQIIRYHRGRVYVVDGTAVYYSEAYMYDRFKLRKNYRQYPSKITVFEPVTNGIWCVSDQTYFLAGGNPEEFQSSTQLNYGAIFGTGMKVPNDNDVVWMSQRGLCRGDQDGNVVNLQEKHIAVNPGAEGAAIVREYDGFKQYIATYVPTGSTTLAASDWMSFEAIRN